MEAQELSWVTPDTDISRRPLRMRMVDSRVFEYLILNVFVDFVCCLTVSSITRLGTCRSTCTMSALNL